MNRLKCAKAKVASCGLTALLLVAASSAQNRQAPGRSIGKVTTQGDLILLTLDEHVLGTPHLFNLAHRTIHFTPAGTGYRIESVPLQWDADFGAPLSGNVAALSTFAFPFSGRSWGSLSIGMTGSLVFRDKDPETATPRRAGSGGGDQGGLSVDRFAELAQAGPALVNTVPAISVFFKPRLSGTRYLKQLPDRAVITWSLTEPVGGIQDMTWTPTVNRFQAVLYKSGAIDLNYDEVHAEDAIVGVYPVVSAAAAQPLAAWTAEPHPALPPHADVTGVKLEAVNGLLLRATLQTRGPVLPESDPAIAGLTYRVCLDTSAAAVCKSDNGLVWTVQGVAGRGRGPYATPRYVAFGTGAATQVRVEGNSLSVQGTLPSGFKPGQQVFVSAEVQAPGETAAPARMPAHAVRLTGITSPAVEFAALRKSDGPFPAAYEVFHYLRPTRAMDLTCSVIQTLGDRFDMLAFYSDFRIDNPEAGTSSTGPLGGGPNGGAVTGIGANQRNLASFCTKGRFQWQFIQPVYIGANQMQEYPPPGLKDPSTRNLPFYTPQLAERTANGKIPPYDYAMSQIGHEMGHRWSAFVSAKVGGEVIPLGPTHWARGLQAPVAFPYQRPTEASAMGGGVWQDNSDGTFTQLDDDYYVPATGWSYLDLYLMGMIAPSEVPDFFILRNLVPAGNDPNGHPVVKADRTRVTIADVIAQEGPRLPAVDQAQKSFNTGMVMVVEHGKTPSPALVKAVTGIRERWIDYWTTTTGHRSNMTADPR